jgi:alpha-beta hydrolase superfamily lysophospholipase
MAETMRVAMGRRSIYGDALPEEHVATYVLIPGAGGMAQYWSRVAPQLRARGQDVASSSTNRIAGANRYGV